MVVLLMVFAHIIVVVFAFGMLVFPGLMAENIALSRDVRTIRTTSGRITTMAKIGGPLVLLAGILGLITAIVEHLPLTESWLVIAYVVFIALMAIGIGVYSRWHSNVYAAAVASPDDAPSPQLSALLDRRISSTIHVTDMVLWIAMFALMVFKPHLW